MESNSNSEDQSPASMKDNNNELNKSTIKEKDMEEERLEQILFNEKLQKGRKKVFFFYYTL